MTTNTKHQPSIFERLNIDKQRGDFLSKTCLDVYENCIKQKNNRDAIDVINECREHTQNASEDIYVCFIVGTLQGKHVAMQSAEFFGKTINAIFSK